MITKNLKTLILIGPENGGAYKLHTLSAQRMR